ncbi:hypothetical protein [Campylobacter ureolyticus]|uniref:hypothetical protein n=1 Tax=Campylobacter ureolyticus TaxID=827 RepID=UPI002931114C|nr:hypothetical protein [Campylobacter ureolyticus]
MQVQNLQSLKNYDWKDLGTILYQTRNVMSKVQGISYDLGNVSRVFEETYKNSSQYKDILKIHQMKKVEMKLIQSNMMKF